MQNRIEQENTAMWVLVSYWKVNVYMILKF